MRAPILAGVALAGVSLAAAAPLVAQTAGLELRALVYGVPSKRNAALSSTTADEESGTMTGAEVSVRTLKFGVSARLITGTVTPSGGSGGGKLTGGEARVQLGPRVLALEGGYCRRAVSSALGTTVYSFLRAGGSSVISIGGTGLTARLSAGVYLAGQESGVTISGHEIVTGLEYRVGRTPFVVALGYRAELFQASAGGVDRAESVRGVVFGGGVRLAR